MRLYLRALEIQGFKSFPEKTRLTFEKAVTGIVGPNGSGKSNISDAILWVMGEQSTRALRGGKMEDVIFGGTVKRSQVGFAEVSLILDNSGGIFKIENTEVMITRRYYRSGESEYYLNRQPVRLRDVNELLMDTGLGREGYSIISQGRIDEILSAKSTDRRNIFEEAAGISRYRHRKEESERKLQRTDENLVRVSDKISELEMQVEPLRQQAETARKYLVLRDELRGFEISVWLENIDSLQKQAETLRADYETAKQQLEDANKNLERLYKSSESFAEQMHGKDIEADNLRETISAAELKCAELDSDVAVNKVNLQKNNEDIARIKSELWEQENRDGGIKAQIDERQGRISDISTEMEFISSSSKELLFKSEDLIQTVGISTNKLNELLTRENESVDRMNVAKVELSALASSAQDLLDRESAVKIEINEAASRLAQIKTDYNVCCGEYQKVQEELQSLNNVISGYTMRAAGRKKKFDLTNEKKIKLTMDLNALKSRMSLLSEMEKEFQGYSKAVKVVMQESSRGVLKNIHGPIADLVKVEDKYTLAIETALGGNMQHIIVDSEEDGKAAIKLLKRYDSGRATFLPMSTVRGNALHEKDLQGEAGFAGIALQLVTFDDKYKGIYTNLLGRIAVVDNLDTAIRVSRKYRYAFRIVTLDGQVINAGGSMTGGSSSKNAGILSRANELQKLSEQELVLNQDMTRIQHELTEAQRELSAAEYELDVSQGEMRVLEDSLLKLASDKKHHEILNSNAEDNMKTLRGESEGLRNKIECNSLETAKIRGIIETNEAAISGLKSEIEQNTIGQESLTQQRESIMAQLADIRAKEASLEAEREALTKAVSELSALRDDLTGGRQGQIQLLENLKRSITMIQVEITAKERENAEMTMRIDDDKKRIAQIIAEKLELEAARTNRDKETQEKNREILNLERECARLEQKKLAVNLEEKQLIDKLWDTYELSRTTAMDVRLPLPNLNEAKRRISDIKREIAKLGNPNIGAIDEFERVNTRYLFLTGQRDDIENAKNELINIIVNITSEMKDIFVREFEVINNSFKETFVELFSGGHASLELEDTTDILNCGIEIKVQPPGKSLKTLTLLSGGEKAFVAIALYFSILKVRPTPFVVMDEIEAALDDANVTRFAEYMHRMSEKTQIIVITHRRGTMEEADVLYGVTMQEQGVSRILNIDLVEAERAIVS